MDTIRQYVLSVICVAVLCGLAQVLLSDGTAGKIVKLIAGMIVTICVLSPVIRDRIWKWDISLEEMRLESSQAVNEGVDAANLTAAQLIKQNTEAYILTKASALGVTISADIVLKEEYPNVPEAICIKGAVSPYVRQILTHCLVNDLGISEENQTWIS